MLRRLLCGLWWAIVSVVATVGVALLIFLAAAPAIILIWAWYWPH